MVTRITADEVSDFKTAVAGVEIDWARTDQGFGPATMTASGDDRVAASAGGLDFSALLHSQVPDDRIVLQYLLRAPIGTSWCGSDGVDLDLRQFRPSTSVFGTVPAGTRAVTLTAWIDPLQDIADDLGLGELRPSTTVDALPKTPEVRALSAALSQVAMTPELMEARGGTTAVLETTARAIASLGGTAHRGRRSGFDSRQIVAACVDYARTVERYQLNISELCTVAHVSESRLRQAFVEVLGVPPIRYFQLRNLSMLRDELVTADPAGSTVTEVAASFGLTQLGRVAGRYRSLYGETPRETLNRFERRRW